MKFWDGVGREFLMRYGVTEFPADFGLKVKAMSIAESSTYFRETFGVDFAVDFIADSMREMVADKYRYEAEFKPNVRETLEALHRADIKMCIATATYADLVDEALIRLKARDYFEFILSCNEVGKSKSHPDIFIECMNRLGGTLENTVVIEDSLHAISTAKSVGFKVIAVSEERQLADIDKIKKVADCYLEIMDMDSIIDI